MTKLHEVLLIIATAAALLIGATLATVFLYGGPISAVGFAVFDRIAKAGGAHGLVTIAEVEAIATVTCAEQAAAFSERAVTVVRRGK